MIRVLVVDDSPVARELVVHLLNEDPEMRVVAAAGDGETALGLIPGRRPDVITMDIHMPKLDGVETTRQIMETHPTPIVIVTGSTEPSQVATTFRAIEAGALAAVRRPAGIGHPEHDATARELVQTVKLMAEVKVVRRWRRARRQEALAPPVTARPSAARAQVFALGASTGGPPVLQTILAALPGDFPLPVLVVQHMATGFLAGFVDWLAGSSQLPVRLAAHGEAARPGYVYVAPDNHQMRVARGGTLVLSADGHENGMRPAVSCLFRSLAEVYGANVVAGLLSGMGRDGAVELKKLRDLGAVTFAQDRESAVVHGMPGEAIRLEAATFVLPPERIAPAIVGLIARERQGERA